METYDVAALERRARWAYERGRLKAAIPWLTPVLAATTVATALGGPAPATLGLGALLGLSLLFLLWRGEALGQGARRGLLTGIAPFALGLLARHGLHACVGGACLATCLPVCAAGGILAGILVMQGALRRADHRLAAFTAEIVVASLLGGLGCLVFGISGLAALALGLALGTVPTGLWAGVARR